MEEKTQFEIKKVEKRKDDKVVKAKKFGIISLDILLSFYNLIVGVLHLPVLYEIIVNDDFIEKFGFSVVLIITFMTNFIAYTKVADIKNDELKLLENIEFNTVDYKFVKDEKKEKEHKNSIEEYDTLTVIFLITSIILKNIKPDNYPLVNDLVLFQNMNVLFLLGRRILSNHLYYKQLERNLDTMLKLEEKMNEEIDVDKDKEKILKK